jgi:hypothetical protein
VAQWGRELYQGTTLVVPQSFQNTWALQVAEKLDWRIVFDVL